MRSIGVVDLDYLWGMAEFTHVHLYVHRKKLSWLWLRLGCADGDTQVPWNCVSSRDGVKYCLSKVGWRLRLMKKERKRKEKLAQ